MSSIPTSLRRGVAAVLVSLLALVAFAPGAGADQVELTDPAGDVPYQRGDITRIKVIHRSNNLDLRVRTRVGGQPVNNWPNLQTYIRWRIETDPNQPGPEYFADLRLLRGVDTVFVGRVRDAHTNTLMPGCGADQFAPTPTALVSAIGNEYRYQFLRGCIGAADPIRVRATFRWDNGVANVGPVYTDYAPNGGPTGPIGAG